jgi:predicted membrane protein
VSQKQNEMATTTYHSSIATNYTQQVSRPSVFTKFLNWSKEQQENRLLWLGLALAGHGCILTPITVFAVALSGNSLPLLILALVAMCITLVTNLAAMPTKITIPAFIFSVIVDISILIACTSVGFNLGKVF